MQKTDILNRLDALGLDKHQYWVITGSAMVLYSIREQTHDIDLGCTAAPADRLEKHGVPVIRQPDGGRKFTIGRMWSFLKTGCMTQCSLSTGSP